VDFKGVISRDRHPCVLPSTKIIKDQYCYLLSPYNGFLTMIKKDTFIAWIAKRHFISNITGDSPILIIYGFNPLNRRLRLSA
jgi:hypothetical protein